IRVERSAHGPGDLVELAGGGRIEQADTTWAYIVCEMPGLEFSHALLNEHSVAVVSDNCPSREDRPQLVQGGIGPRLRWLVAERAKTAREGVKLVGALVEKFGYSASGRTLTIGDPAEAWQVALVNGRHWVARRVPDDQVAVLANSYGIHEVDLADTLDFLGSPDLIDYAQARGWYDPNRDGGFDFERAYARPDLVTDPNQRLRQWTGYRHLAGGTFPVPEEGRPLPFSIRPAQPVTRQHLYAVLRDHYEGTPYEAAWGRAHDTPAGYSPRTVCHGSTNHGDVFELKGDGRGAGTVWWTALWRPCASPFVPIFLMMDGVPRELYFEVDKPVYANPGSVVMPGREMAIGVFRDLTLTLDAGGWAGMKEVRSVWEKWERGADRRVGRLTGRSGSTSGRRLYELSEALLREAMNQARSYLERNQANAADGR
ncbi:MAG: C69 family dipeptidase, partial [Candidatus Glassbacteria bacterium]